MKPKNFPARKLTRQLEAKMRSEKRYIATDEELQAIKDARQIRTKKRRG